MIFSVLYINARSKYVILINCTEFSKQVFKNINTFAGECKLGNQNSRTAETQNRTEPYVLKSASLLIVIVFVE